MDASAWNKSSTAPVRGSIPDTTAKMVAVEYVSSIGTANNYVYVYLAEEGAGVRFCLSRLAVGEGCVIPLWEKVAYGAAFTQTAADAVGVGGIDPAKLHIVCTDYDSGTNEATINVLLAGR